MRARRNRYGMHYSTIRYAQNQARLLRSLVDWKPVALLMSRDARQLAINAVMAASVLTTDEMRNLLKG